MEKKLLYIYLEEKINMKKFYKIENGKAQVGSGTFVPDTFIEYIVGQEPQELLEALAFESSKSNLEQRIAEANQYLSSTGWIWEKYSRNVIILGDLTNDEFKLKYADIITKQEEARVLINTLELELKGVV